MYLAVFNVGIGSLLAQVQELCPKRYPIMDRAQSYGGEDAVKHSPFTRGGGISNATVSFGDTLFAETFSRGLAGDPGNGNWNVAGNAAWEYRGPSTTPDVSVGSRGALVGNRGPIQSPTAANGFMIFDSDYLDNNGDSNAMGQGNSPTPHLGIIESPTVNFSGYPSLFLDMRSYFRRFQGTCYMVFSIDNGLTWGDTLHIYDADFTVNSSTAPDARVLMPLPPSVPDNPQVKVRIVFDGVTESNANGSGYYFWMIDDLYFVEAPRNELELLEVYLGSNRRHLFGNIPYRHAKNDTIFVSGWIRNNGINTRPNSRIDTYFNGNLENSSQSITSSPGSLDSLYNDGYIVLDQPAIPYPADFVVASDLPDHLPENDTISMRFNITDSVYSRVPDHITMDNGSFFENYNYSIGTLFPFSVRDTIKSVDIYFSESSAKRPSGVIITVWGKSFNPIERLFTTVTPEMLGDWTTFDINDVIVRPGQEVIVGWEAVGDSVSWVQGGHRSDPETVFVRPNNSNETWFFTTFANPKIRINVTGDCPDITGEVNNIQNPACGMQDGAATVTPDDTNHSVIWPDNTLGETNTALAAGVYNVSIVDTNNCVGEIQVVLGNDNAPENQDSGIDIIQEISCNPFNDPDGNLSNDAILAPQFTGGVPPYTFLWTGSHSTSDSAGTGHLEGLGAGTYRVTVIDNAGCKAFSEGVAHLSHPEVMEIEVIHTAMGALEAEVISGGVPPFSFEWNTGETGQTIFTDRPEYFSYSVTVTDANNCIEVWDFSTGTNDLKIIDRVNVYPNPNNGLFNIEFSNLNDEFTITLRNIVGQIVGAERVTVNGSDVHVMNYDNLSSGIYLLEVTSAEGSRAVYRLSIK